MLRAVKDLIFDTAIPRHRGCGGRFKREGRRFICAQCRVIRYSPSPGEEGKVLQGDDAAGGTTP